MRQRMAEAAEAKSASRKAAKSCSVRVSATLPSTLPVATVEAGDQCLRAVPDVFELAPLDLARPHRQGRGDASERLDAGHLVDRHRPHRLLGLDGAAVDAAYVNALGFEIRIGLGREPGPDAMRLEVGFFLKKSPHRAGRDRGDDAAAHRFARQIAGAPMADRNPVVVRPLAGQRHDGTDLLRRDGRRRARARRIGEPLRGALAAARQPAAAPEAHALAPHAELLGRLADPDAVGGVWHWQERFAEEGVEGLI